MEYMEWNGGLLQALRIDVALLGVLAGRIQPVVEAQLLAKTHADGMAEEGILPQADNMKLNI